MQGGSALSRAVPLRLCRLDARLDAELQARAVSRPHALADRLGLLAVQVILLAQAAALQLRVGVHVKVGKRGLDGAAVGCDDAVAPQRRHAQRCNLRTQLGIRKVRSSRNDHNVPKRRCPASRSVISRPARAAALCRLGGRRGRRLAHAGNHLLNRLGHDGLVEDDAACQSRLGCAEAVQHSHLRQRVGCALILEDKVLSHARQHAERVPFDDRPELRKLPQLQRVCGVVHRLLQRAHARDRLLRLASVLQRRRTPHGAPARLLHAVWRQRLVVVPPVRRLVLQVGHRLGRHVRCGQRTHALWVQDLEPLSARRSL